MSRLRRFGQNRYVGTRDDMIVYDCDDADQFADLERRVEEDGLSDKLLVSSFAPDSIEEARNRGFTPVAGSSGGVPLGAS